MKIKKYKKKSNGLYELEFDNFKKLVLYEDTILKYELLTKPFDVKNMYEMEYFNQECDVYYVALKYLKFKPRTVFELKNYLLKKEYPLEAIEKAIDKLTKQGYLNDLSYCKSYLNMKIMTSNNGPGKIKKELLKRGVSADYIDEAMNEFTSDIELEKIRKIISKKIKANHNKSGRILKQKIIMDLVNEGFNKAIVMDEISKQKFTDSPEFIKKEYDKLYKKLSRKYSGEELDFKIKQKMYQKGLGYEEIS